MTESHPTPDDIEALAEGAAEAVRRFGPHLESCAACRGAVDEARSLLWALETLPDSDPPALLVDRVMAEVQLFEPWHAALGRTVAPWMPDTRSGQVAAGVGALLTGALGASGVWWLLGRADMAVVLGALGIEQVQLQLRAAGEALALMVMGDGTREALQHGSTLLIGSVLSGCVVTASAGVLMVRHLARQADGVPPS